MNAVASERRLTELWETPRSLYGRLATVDHKIVGVRYLVTSMAFLVVGGLEALLLRLQLAEPDGHVLAPEAYDQVFSMHGITMIFWYAAPILSGFANYLVPLMLGARDMALPRLNAFSYWTFLLSGLFLYGSLLVSQAPHAGWFAYVPYTLREYSPGLNMDFYALALVFLTISTTAGAVNFLVSIFRLRAPGMSINRMPLFMYSTSTTSALIVLALPALTAACVFLELDRRWGTHFFDTAAGGSPLLWQHAFWFFGHPWVYVVFLPATGMISMILPVFARRPIVGYTWVALSTVLTGVVGMGVWVHHMFATGMSQLSMSFFAAASMTISIFSTVQVFAWLATLYYGRPVMASPLRFALGFIALFIIGGLNGVITAIIPFDWQLTDTYFVVAHLHYVLIGANVFPVFAAFYYWLPKITGRMMDETAGRASFWLMFVGFMVGFFPMHVLGLLGMPRRVYTYPAGLGWDSMNMVVTVGGFLFALGVLVSLVNFVVSARSGRPAGANPWNADSLEWSTDSPPPAYGSTRIPTVRGRHPLWDAHDEERDPGDARVLDEGRYTLATTAIDATPTAVAKMPEDTIAPLVLALLLAGFFTAALLTSLPWMAACALAAIAAAAYWLWPGSEKHRDGPASRRLLDRLPWDDVRGSRSMGWFIATEAFLFVSLFFAYFYLGHDAPRWPMDEPPKLKLALTMLVVLLASSALLFHAERVLKTGRHGAARIATLGTIALGAVFLVLQGLEYRDHLRTLQPTTDAYGSIFYTITSVHGLHLLLGLGMLAYALLLPRLEPTEAPPHRPLHNAALYWHFVDGMWIVIVAVLYVLPNVTRMTPS